MQQENINRSHLKKLNESLNGSLHFDETIRKIYATDASSYREIPLAVAYPKDKEDIINLIGFANAHNVSLIPRTAGTSLAGQVVGKGIVVDVSKYFTKILEDDPDEKWVRVQPGVVRDELNQHLKPKGFLFGPETSTANRAMIGGMIGNNSCGSNSVVYGSTRDHLLEVCAILSDGSEVVFGEINGEEFENKCELDSMEGKIYRGIRDLLQPQEIKDEIEDKFPLKSIKRRNTGYAIDLLLPMVPFKGNGTLFNFSRLIAGSEGTLAFIIEAKLNIVPLPPVYSGLLCIHFTSIYESMKATQIALKYNPSAVELIDHFILECTKGNIQHVKNRFFLKGDPNAIIVVELRRDSEQELENVRDALIEELNSNNYGYHHPYISGEQETSVWNLRKAGLGLLSNLPGDAKPVPVVEDTAVTVDDLPEYIREFDQKMEEYNLKCVHYAHAGSGEIHLRPILNLKTEEGNRLFRQVATDIATLVKKYKGSLSGEHGDGRLRGEFIPFMIGEKNFELLKKVKKLWDPNNILNPGKIVDTPSMNSQLRYYPGQETLDFPTTLDFSGTKGMVRAAELCNGAGDCRKTHLIGGTMCPSFMATKNEKDTTRARANIIREVFTRSSSLEAFNSSEIKEILDLCLSCKGCKLECPSNVDMAKLKAEFMHKYYQSNKIPLRSRMIANIAKINKYGSIAPWLYNFILKSPLGTLNKKILGIERKRDFPKLNRFTLRSWISKQIPDAGTKGKVYLFIDEFTNYSDVEVGMKTVILLNAIGYKVETVAHRESGRAAMSKGMLGFARDVAEDNVRIFSKIISEDTPLVGIEPSAILSFRDEYPDLLRDEMKEKAATLSENTYLIDEFLSVAFTKGEIDSSLFTKESKSIKLHGHCHQKAISSTDHSQKILTIPENYEVDVIPSGCCGMAGSFGFEKEHYELSMQIGELVLFPTVRDTDIDTVIAAPGTSCRHQIKDGTQRKSYHPVEILHDALLPQYKA